MNTLHDALMIKLAYCRHVDLPVSETATSIEALVTRKHRYWGAGEPDCPREIKASNGELWKLRCKVCGQDNPGDTFCLPAIEAHKENPAEGAPYGEGLIGRIDALTIECQRLRTALQYIADLAYVDHQSGNQNFECLQGIARDAIREQSNGA